MTSRTAVAASTSKALQEAAGDNGPLLAQLAPSLRQKVRGMSAAPQVSADKLREQLFHAIFEFLTGVQAKRPLLIVLDDLQWADDATVLLLRDLAERVAGSHMVVIGTYWDTELDSARPFARAVTPVAPAPAAQRIALGPLTTARSRRSWPGLPKRALSLPTRCWASRQDGGQPAIRGQSALYMAESESMLGAGARSPASPRKTSSSPRACAA